MWIEIYSYGQVADRSSVTPLAGVWIEIFATGSSGNTERSLPSRECGLKSVWHNALKELKESLPSRECGLKSISDYVRWRKDKRVTPLAGVWIEIPGYGTGL